MNEFLAAGFNRAQLLDVMTITALKSISNYTNHLAKRRSTTRSPARSGRARTEINNVGDFVKS